MLITNLLVIIPLSLVGWMAYAMWANDTATNFIDENIDNINPLLDEFDLTLSVGLTWCDIAPCEITYSIHYTVNKNPNEIFYLPSRKIKRLILKLKLGKISAIDVVRYCKKYGKSQVKKSNWNQLK